MSHLTIRDLSNSDHVLDKAALRGIRGGFMPQLRSLSGGSFASASATAVAIGGNTYAYAKAEAFALAAPGEASARSYSMALSFSGAGSMAISIASSQVWARSSLSQLH
jgi:hypothetical protein